MLALVCNFSIWERFLVLRSLQSSEDNRRPTTVHDVLVLRQVSTQWCQQCSGPASWRRGGEEPYCSHCSLRMNALLKQLQIQEASKEYRRWEFLKGFSYLMEMCISSCLPAFTWFDLGTLCQSVHCECYCCLPCPLLILWHSIPCVRWGLLSHFLPSISRAVQSRQLALALKTAWLASLPVRWGVQHAAWCHMGRRCCGWNCYRSWM